MRHSLFFLLLVPVIGFSQKTVDVTKNSVNPIQGNLFYIVGGVPFSSAKYVEVVSGSPYYSEDWMKADLVITGSGVHKNIPVKIDLLSGELIYKDSAGNEMLPVSAVKQATLKDPVSGKDIVFISPENTNPGGKKPAAGWYQLLEEGSASFYKKFHKIIKETRPFNSATTEQSIYTSNKYFIAHANTLTEVKNVKDVPSVLSDKSKELEAFIRDNKISGKEESAFSSVVSYYNSLFSK